MTKYSWEDVQDEVADLARIAEDIEKRTSVARIRQDHDFYGPIPPTDAPTLEFTRDGIEQLQEDVITFLDQFDEMPQDLVDEICQTIINYYIKHRPNPGTALNPSGDHKTL